ncbi:MAG: endonuclease/exonuclease/phosphatase family protein [Bacteroidales bacterium]
MARNNKNSKKKDKHSAKRKKRNSSKLSFFGIIMLILSIIISILLIFSLIAEFFLPSKVSGIAFIGIGFSYLFFSEIICFLYFLIKRKKIAIFLLIIILSLIPAFSRVFMLNKENNKEDFNNTLTLVSYNVQNLSNNKLVQSNDEYEKVISFLNSCNSDIICLQETNFKGNNPELFFNDIQQKTNSTHYCFTKYYPGTNSCIAIFTKHPIVNIASIRSNNKSFAIYCDMVFNNDTIRILTTHLQSLHLNLNEVYNITHTAEDAKLISKKIYGKTKYAFIKREKQIKELVELIKSTPYEIILCGDFNDTPCSYSYRSINNVLNDSFKKVGRGFAYSFKTIPLLRIDYVFTTNNITPLDYKVRRDIKFSDHYPIITNFTIKN